VEPLAEYVRYDIWWRVEAGYQSREEIIAAVVQNWSDSIWWVEAAHQSQEEAIAAVEAKWSSDDYPDQLESAIRHATEELIAEHLREQAAWPAVTDCDRLDASFADLNGRGILARQNYEQTLTSGAAAVWEEIRQEQAKRPVRGFVFFHEQDAEQAVRCDGPVLAWGAVAEEDSAWKELAEEIMAVLRMHGLNCSWAGSTNSRISIDGMRWQRRMSDKAEPSAAADRGRSPAS
jgi:hypothetical protein